MSNIIISDGTGSGNKVQVTDKNRLVSETVISTAFGSAIQNGGSFAVYTSVMKLTSDSESAVLYVRNDSEDEHEFREVYVNVGTSDGTGNLQRKFFYEPTGGTIISDENEAGVLNLNRTSAKLFNGVAYEGGEGKTLTGGISQTELGRANQDSVFGAQIIVGRGQSFGMSITPPPGNSDMDVVVELTVYKLSEV